MRLSTKTRYGLRAIFDIAYHCGTESCQIQDISRRQNLSQRYLEQIFQTLKKAGILRSKRGPQGGYILAKDPREITVRDIINATEGDILLVECATSGRKNVPCSIDSACATQTVWQEAAQLLDSYFASLTLHDLCARGEKLGMKREKDLRLMYHI